MNANGDNIKTTPRNFGTNTNEVADHLMDIL